MELIFNDLSEMPLCHDKTNVYQRVEKLLETYKAANRFGYNIIRTEKGIDSIKVMNNYTLGDFCNEPKHSRTIGTLLRGLIRTPYISSNSKEEDEYIKNTFKLQKGGEELDAFGLVAAFLYSTPAIGFLSEDFWGGSIFSLKVYPSGKTVEVYCLSDEMHLEDVKVINFIENNQPLELCETYTAPENKKCVLRHDHGKDVLLAFSKRILRSTYVEAVINSIPFNPRDRNFIREVYPNGIIEVVLTGTDRGLGIVIQTTGRNLRETKAIAEIINEKFSD